MSHTHAASTEKLPLHKRIKRLALFEWPNVQWWLAGLLAAHFWAISKVIGQSSRGEQFDIMGNMLVPAILFILAVNRSALEERSSHGDRWMMVGTICYGVALLTLLLFMNHNIESIVGVTWLTATGGLFASFTLAGGHHH